MAIFDKITQTISEAGKEGLNKAKELRDTAKLSMDIKEREISIQKMYREIGKAYYKDHKDDVEPVYEQVSAITAAFEEIAELKTNKDEVRGIRRCEECGKSLADEAKFCPNCGAKCELDSEFVECDIVEDEDICEDDEASAIFEDESEETEEDQEALDTEKNTEL